MEMWLFRGLSFVDIHKATRRPLSSMLSATFASISPINACSIEMPSSVAPSLC